MKVEIKSVTEPLGLDRICREIPAVTYDESHNGSFFNIPTISILNKLKNWHEYYAGQNSYPSGRGAHCVRLRVGVDYTDCLNQVIPELMILNSSNTECPFTVYMGVSYKSRSYVVSKRVLSISHSKNNRDRDIVNEILEFDRSECLYTIDAVYRLIYKRLVNYPVDIIEKMFAVRHKNVLEKISLDNSKNYWDLYTTLHDKVVGGGLRFLDGSGKYQQTKPITSLVGTLKLSRNLWTRFTGLNSNYL